MDNLDSILERLPEKHRNALQWFMNNSGSVQTWPKTIMGDTLLTSKAKGIYKPNWTKYVLSVRQSLGGPYPDQEPVIRDDGTWSYLYFQENPDPDARDSEYTNIGMIECLKDGVPIGVIRQVSKKPVAHYKILGLAIVAGWERGYFFLEGFSSKGLVHQRGPQAQIDAIVVRQEVSQNAADAFKPVNLIDARERVTTAIVLRRGQAEFRRQLLKAYKGMCAVTGCTVAEVLEAAHIVPYLGPETNHSANGILLRADIHTLFDLGMIAVDSNTMKLVISSPLKNTVYDYLDGKELHLPETASERPNKEALDYHRKWTGL